MKSWSEYLADETEKKETRVSRERARQLEESKKQTNADRIRNMSDEELAECFATLVICEICEYCGENKCNRSGDEFLCTTATSAKMLYKWLKSEVKE